MKHTPPKARRPLPEDESEDRQIRREPNAQYRQYGLHDAHSFGHEKIPRLYVPTILSPETQPPKGVKSRAGTRAP
jgi:hypothetical protein